MSDRPVDIFLSVAEDSADVHAAALMRAAAASFPDWRFFGLTGPRTRALGAETVADMTAHAAMLAGAASVVGKAWAALRAVDRAWKVRRPTAALFLDSPALHLRLARRARRLGIPVVYYIAPQTWASRPGRNREIAACVDRLACILPFEEPYFRSRGIDARYVGHPLFESLSREQPDPQAVSRLRSGAGPLVALLPGSRRHVIDTVLPLQLEVLAHLRTAITPLRAAVSAVDEARAQRIAPHLPQGAERPEIVVADNASLLTAADLVLVASGTATLHVAHYRKPMVVLYEMGGLLGRLASRFGHWVVRTPHLSLVNILAGARVVPEYMPHVPDTHGVAQTAAALLLDTSLRDYTTRRLDELVGPLESPPYGRSASANVCELIASVIAERGATAPTR